MAKGNWSASRISTFRTCPLKYYYTYVKKWVSSIPADNTAANKGTAFHETVEHYHTGMSHDELHKIMEGKVVEYNVDTTVYDEYAALERFYLFWENYIAPREREGFIVKQEDWATNKLPSTRNPDALPNPDKDGEEPALLPGPLDEPFVGALDLFLEHPTTGEYIIFDYKSGKSPQATKYRSQLILYAYLIGLNKGYTYAQMAEKCKLMVFFPLAKDDKIDKLISMEDKMFASVKQLRLTEKDIEDTVAEYKDTIGEIHSMDWDNVEAEQLAVPNYLCQWCDYKGSHPQRNGFKGCPALSYLPNPAVFTLKE